MRLQIGRSWCHIWAAIILLTQTTNAQSANQPAVPPRAVKVITVPDSGPRGSDLVGPASKTATPDGGAVAKPECNAAALLEQDRLGALKVKSGVEKLYFLAGQNPGGPDCPSQSPACHMKSFVIGGDEVIMTRPDYNHLICGHYISDEGKITSGWLDYGALDINSGDPLDFDSPDARGRWVNAFFDASVTIAAGADGYVAVEGEATRGPPSYNTGSFSGFAYLGQDGVGATAGFDDGQYTGGTPATMEPENNTACRVRFRFIGHYLRVDDNLGCGGNGVSFTGIYVRAKPGMK